MIKLKLYYSLAILFLFIAVLGMSVAVVATRRANETVVQYEQRRIELEKQYGGLILDPKDVCSYGYQEEGGEDWYFWCECIPQRISNEFP